MAVYVVVRSAIRPASPSLLLLLADADAGEPKRPRASAFCLSPQSSIAIDHRLAALLSSFCCHCIGSSDGWLAVAVYGTVFALINSLTGEEIPFPSFSQPVVGISKVVFAPNPTPGDFTAVAITGVGGLSYAAAGSSKWTDLDCRSLLVGGDCFSDVLYHHEKRGKKKKAELVYCLTIDGDVHVIHLLPGRRGQAARVEPLPSKRSATQVFDPAAAFAPPYDTVAKFPGAKHLAVCGGELYQIWRNIT